MKNSNILYTSEFGERVIVKRVFLPGSIDKEALMLLCEMLNTKLSLDKKSISQYASGQLLYSCDSYRNGFVLQGTLFQVEAKGLSYVLVDPYQKALSILSDLSEERIEMDEKTFSLCKERVFSHESLDNMDWIHSMLRLDGAPLTADKEKVLSLTKQEVKKVLSLAKESNVGDWLYIGPKGKKEPFYDLKGFESPLSSVIDDAEVEYREYHSYCFVKETKVYVFRLPKEVTSYDEYLTVTLALKLYMVALEQKLSESFGSKISFESGFIDRKNVYVSATVAKGKMAILLPKLETVFSALSFENAYEDGLVLYRESELLKCIYVDNAVKQAEKLMDLGIALPDSYLSLVEVDKDCAIETAKSLELVSSMTLLGAEKKEEIL